MVIRIHWPRTGCGIHIVCFEKAPRSDDPRMRRTDEPADEWIGEADSPKNLEPGWADCLDKAMTGTGDSRQLRWTGKNRKADDFDNPATTTRQQQANHMAQVTSQSKQLGSPYIFLDWRHVPVAKWYIKKVRTTDFHSCTVHFICSNCTCK